MKRIIKLAYILIFLLTNAIIGCAPKTDLCDQPEIKQELKKLLVLDLKAWQKNAQYAGIENFEEKVNQVIEDLEIIEIQYIGENDFPNSEVYIDQNAPGAASCRCSTKIRFKDHENYKQLIEGPVNKVKAEEHQLNSAYLRFEEKINYLDNDGFNFSFVVMKEENKRIQVIQFYPLALESNIDDAGKLIFEYVESFN